ncbi:MAG: hypothetical protein ACRDIX_04875 [Actinomycetota bacterium]
MRAREDFLQELQPSWVASVCRLWLPEGILGLYVSYNWGQLDERNQTARLLVLETNRLCGIKLSAVISSASAWENVEIEIASIHLTSVTEVGYSLKIYAGEAPEYPTREFQGWLALRDGLLDFQNPVVLPLDQSDYRGNWRAQGREFLQAVEAIFPPAYPLDGR